MVRLADGQRLHWRTLPRRQGLESVPVAGTSHRPKALQDAGFAPGKPVSLVPEPENPHDPNAIGVWNLRQTQQAGYLPRDVARRITKRLQKPGDDRIAAMVLWETWDDDGERVALRLLLVSEGANVAGVQFQ